MESVAVRYERERLIELLQRDALRHGTFTLASGRTSHYYVDGRKLTLSAEGAALIGAGVLELLRTEFQVDAVGGLTMGADPIVGATLALASAAGSSHLRGFLVRKEAKGHGTGKLVEGPLEPGSTVAIVDDVATTGGSSLQAVEAVRGDGLQGRGGDRRARPARRGRGRVRRARLAVSCTFDDSRPGRRAAAAAAVSRARR